MGTSTGRPSASPTIVTLGGGGFSDAEETTSLIDDHLLAKTGTSMPKVCFIGTASGDSMDYRQRFTDAFEGRAHTMTLPLFGFPDYIDPAVLHEQDLIYVVADRRPTCSRSGGCTVSPTT